MKWSLKLGKLLGILRCNDLVKALSGVTHCTLAASAPIHKQLFDALDSNARAKIHRVIASNLAKTNPNELLGHFEKAASLSTQSL